VLQNYSDQLLDWTYNNYFIAVLIYIFSYSLGVIISMLGIIIFTLTGGFLFGIWFGILFVNISVLLDATALFLSVKIAFTDWFRRRTSKWVIKLQGGFEKNAFQYMLFLRLMPIFPLSIINIFSALFDVPLKTFMVTTFMGALPRLFIYVTLGSGLGQLMEEGRRPEAGIIFEPQIFFPLIGLAVLSVLSTLIHKFVLKNKLIK
jgi:uncharacterized membrane protein YdjX (TVP38/TMEM64 family)